VLLLSEVNGSFTVPQHVIGFSLLMLFQNSGSKPELTE